LNGARVCWARKSGDTHVLPTSPLVKILEDSNACLVPFSVKRDQDYIDHFLTTLVAHVL